MSATNVKVTVKARRSGSGCCPRTSSAEAHYRLLLPAGSRNLEQLRTHIAVAAAPAKDGTELSFDSLVYIDGDGDTVRLRSDADLQAALAALPPHDGGGDGSAVLRLHLDRTAIPPPPGGCGASGGCGAAGGPCCFLKAIFAFLFVYHAFRWCCPVMLAVLFAVGTAKLVDYCCRARGCQPSAGARCCRDSPPPPFWCPARSGGCGWLRQRPPQFHVFTTAATPPPLAEAAAPPESAAQLARAWDIGLPEAAAALVRAAADPAVRELVAAALLGEEGAAAAAADASPATNGATTGTTPSSASSKAAAAVAPATTTALLAELEAEEPQFVAVAAAVPAPVAPAERLPAAAPTAAAASDSSTATTPTAATASSQLAILTDTMGFDEVAAVAALAATGGDVREAIQKLLQQ